MTEAKEKSSVLQACVGNEQTLADLIEYSADSVVSKTILDKAAGTITLFAFDKGQKLSEHTTPYDAVVQILDGRARLTIGGQEKHISTGKIIIMPGNVPHAVAADEKFKILLTMIRV
jgi:quercetin dioxygenase-like cupin family protein